MARARSAPKNLIERLADAGEEAISRIADAPGVGRVVESAGGAKERLDELSLKVRGLEGMERRLQELERRVEELSQAARPARTRPPAARKPAAKPKPKAAAAKKPGPVPGP